MQVYQNPHCSNLPTFRTSSSFIVPLIKDILSHQVIPGLNFIYYYLPAPIYYSHFFFCAFSQCTNSIHFLHMFPQGTSDVCVILELSKSFLFLVTFSQLFQFTWYSCSNVQGWVSHYGVSIWSSQRVFFDHALDSSIF